MIFVKTKLIKGSWGIMTKKPIFIIYYLIMSIFPK